MRARSQSGKEYANKQQWNTCILYIFIKGKIAQTWHYSYAARSCSIECAYSRVLYVFFVCVGLLFFQWASGRCD